MKLLVKKGRTSLLVRIFIQDSSSSTGAGLTGLAYNTSSLVCYRARDDDGNAGATAISLVTATRGTWASGGFVEKDSTNMPGWYEFGIPNAAIASGSETVDIMLKGATNMAPVNIEIQLVAYDPQDAVRAGLTALPNANAEAAGGLFTRGSGAGQINQAANGNIDVNAVKMSGTALTARDVGASVLLSAGTGTGQLDFTSGVVKANLAQILGTALTETAGQIAAAFKKVFDVASPVFTATSVNQTGDNYARLGAPAGASLAADIAAVKSDSGAVKTQTDKLTFTVANQIDANVLDWKSATAPAMTGDAFARLGAPVGASISADIAGVPAALLDKTDGVESGLTLRQHLRLSAAVLYGKASGMATTTATFRDTNDTTDRVVATVDASGNRSALTLNPS